MPIPSPARSVARVLYKTSLTFPLFAFTSQKRHKVNILIMNSIETHVQNKMYRFDAKTDAPNNDMEISKMIVMFVLLCHNWSDPSVSPRTRTVFICRLMLSGCRYVDVKRVKSQRRAPLHVTTPYNCHDVTRLKIMSTFKNICRYTHEYLV